MLFLGKMTGYLWDLKNVFIFNTFFSRSVFKGFVLSWLNNELLLVNKFNTTAHII